MVKRTDHRGSFTAIGNDGSAHRIYISVNVVGASRTAECEESMNLRSDRGHQLHRIEQGKYEIAGTGVIVTSTDPKAP